MKLGGLNWLLLFSLATPALAVPTTRTGTLNLAELRANAEKGNAQAQCDLAAVLFLGDLGVPKNEAQAVSWWRKAAEQNHAEAQYNLGICYEKGLVVSQDFQEAVKWYRRAAEQDFGYPVGTRISSGDVFNIQHSKSEKSRTWIPPSPQIPC